MFAIIRTGGKQYRVAEQELIRVDKVAGKPGDLIEFGEVLLIGGESVAVGSPTVSGAKVAGEVVEQGRGDKVIAFKKRRRKNSRRKRGYRQEFSLIRITEILAEGGKPKARSATAEAQRTEAAPAVQGAPEQAPAAQAAAVEPAPAAPQASAAPDAAQAEAKPRARKPAAKSAEKSAEAEAKPAAEPAGEKPAKPKAAAKPKKEAAAADAETEKTPAKKSAAKKPAADHGKDQKK